MPSKGEARALHLQPVPALTLTMPCLSCSRPTFDRWPPRGWGQQPHIRSGPLSRSCPYIRHDLYLPSIPASLQTLGRVECAVASAPAPPGLRTISPPTLTLVFSEPSGRLQKFGPEFFLPSAYRRFGLCPCAPTLVLSSSSSSHCLHLGMNFSSLSFSLRLKFACF